MIKEIPIEEELFAERASGEFIGKVCGSALEVSKLVFSPEDASIETLVESAQWRGQDTLGTPVCGPV